MTGAIPIEASVNKIGIIFFMVVFLDKQPASTLTTNINYLHICRPDIFLFSENLHFGCVNFQMVERDREEK